MTQPGAPASSTLSLQQGEQESRLAKILSRQTKTASGRKGVVSLLSLTGLLTWLSFFPVDFGPLAWVALVPLLLLVRIPSTPRYLYRLTFLVGTLYWLATLQWMRLGDPTMYIGLAAMSLYLACYWTIFVWLSRTAVHRLQFPFLLAVPVIWVGLEYIRAHMFTGFSWYYLGHTQYRWINLIQVSDLGGAYLVSFLVAIVNASLAQLVPLSRLKKFELVQDSEAVPVAAQIRRNYWGVGIATGLVLLGTGYGMLRRSGDTFPRGPRVGLIQGNFTASLREHLYDDREIFMHHRHLTGLTVSHSPDVIVWPEGMFPYGIRDVEQGVSDEVLAQNFPDIPAQEWREKQTQNVLIDLADMTNAALIIGLTAQIADATGYKVFNSAAMFEPGIGSTGRYDKIHRVPFGEYIPLADSLPFLQMLTPYRGQFGIAAGREAHVFRQKESKLIPIICFEDTVPHLVRRIAAAVDGNGTEQTEVLVNMSNDGWFHGSSELDQHLVTSVFRAVETRMPLVRAVNTGISAVIDGDGVIREPEEFIDGSMPGDGQTPHKSIRNPRTGRFHKQISCALVADVPLDPRRSVYVAAGDWFAILCFTGTMFVSLRGAFLRWSSAPATASTASDKG